MPAIFFRYELSPIRIQYTVSMMKMQTFIVRVCAIIGGIYAVSSIFESILRNSIYILGFGTDDTHNEGASTMKRPKKEEAKEYATVQATDRTQDDEVVEMTALEK